MESSCEDDYFYDSEEDYDSEIDDDELAHKIFSGGKGNAKAKIYCAICAGKHTEEKCPNKIYNRSYQLNSVRDNFAKATKFQQVGHHYDRRYERYDRDSGKSGKNNYENHYHQSDKYDRNSHRNDSSYRNKDKYGKTSSSKKYDRYDN